MSVKIRLAKTGRKNSPAYKIVVMNTRDKRNGRALDILGHYNPSVTPEEYMLDEAKYNAWIAKGAQVTDAVVKLKEGKYEHIEYDPKGKKAAKKQSGDETKEAKDVEAEAESTSDTEPETEDLKPEIESENNSEPEAEAEADPEQDSTEE